MATHTGVLHVQHDAITYAFRACCDSRFGHPCVGSTRPTTKQFPIHSPYMQLLCNLPEDCQTILPPDEHTGRPTRTTHCGSKWMAGLYLVLANPRALEHHVQPTRPHRVGSDVATDVRCHRANGATRLCPCPSPQRPALRRDPPNSDM